MIRVACQTYTWEMLGAGWNGRVPEILDAVAGAGYTGIEITNTMIGEYVRRPEAFRREAGARGLELAAFAYATGGFTDPARLDEDRAGLRHAVNFAAAFPEPRLALGGAALATNAHAGPAQRRAALDRAIRFYNEAGRLGAEAGVSVNVHPHSHHGSLLETAEDYAYLVERLEPTVSMGPDTGHIVRGGQDLLGCLRTHLARITHLHVKDVTATGVWAPLGKGVCDFRGVLGLLGGAGWRGWIVAEEESEGARGDPVAAIRANRAWLRDLGLTD